MTGRHRMPDPAPTPEPGWSLSDLTADDARAIRAEERAREIGATIQPIPRTAYVAAQTARTRADYRRAVVPRVVIRWPAVILAAVLALMIAAGVLGLALTRPIPGIG
jgi:hypothetical protein